ncbi:MAG: hypothetical protein CMM46_15180 [Rhodospirillaceae bacterium]|nr:hypothetical protein [Rhodospirillaceae bacterium]
MGHAPFKWRVRQQDETLIEKDICLRPIVPLVGSAADEQVLPKRPHTSVVDLQKTVSLMSGRLKAVASRLIRTNVGWWQFPIQPALGPCFATTVQPKLRRVLAAKLSDLDEFDQREGELGQREAVRPRR